MNKNDLIAAVAEKAGVTKTDASKTVDALFDAVTGALANGDDVRIVGFGTFATAQRKASTGRNPRTGQAIQIPASRQPKFRPGAALKEKVNG